MSKVANMEPGPELSLYQSVISLARKFKVEAQQLDERKGKEIALKKSEFQAYSKTLFAIAERIDNPEDGGQKHD